MIVFVAGLLGAVWAYIAVGMVVGGLPERLRLRPFAPNPRVGAGSKWFIAAGVPVSSLQFWAVSIMTGIAGGLIVLLVSRLWLVGVICGVGIGLLPRAFFAAQARKDARARVEAWPETIRSISASMTSNRSLHSSLVGLADSAPTTLRPVFRRYAQLAATLDARTALEVIRDELADPVSDRVVEDLLVALDQGTSVVVRILQDLADMTGEDLLLAERIETAQLEQQLTARAVAVLPFGLLIVMTATDNPWRRFYQTGTGGVIVAIGGIAAAFGLYMVNRLSVMPKEPRVFPGPGADQL